MGRYTAGLMSNFMSNISRYIFRQIAFGTLGVAMVLTSIVWLTQSLQFLQFIISRGLSIGAWLKLTTLLLPSFVAVILPTALFVVVVFIYNKLARDRELVVVQAAGVSRTGVSSPALLMAAICVTFGYFLSLFAVPAAYRAFRETQWNLRSNISQVMVHEGAFNNLAEGLTVYVRDRGANGELLGIVVHDTRLKDKSITLMAERGVFADGTDTPQIIMLNGSRQELPRDTGNLSLLNFETYALDLGDIATAAGDRYADNRERPTLELLAARESATLPERTVARMHAEAHARLVGPIAALGYTLVALAFLLTGSFDKRGQIERIAGAVGLIIALQAGALGAMNLAARTLAFVPLMYMVALLPVAAGLYMIAAPDFWLFPFGWFQGLRPRLRGHVRAQVGV